MGGGDGKRDSSTLFADIRGSEEFDANGDGASGDRPGQSLSDFSEMEDWLHEPLNVPFQITDEDEPLLSLSEVLLQPRKSRRTVSRTVGVSAEPQTADPTLPGVCIVEEAALNGSEFSARAREDSDDECAEAALNGSEFSARAREDSDDECAEA
eukprot:Hpha_TRINITY_DN14339_c0_g3::TRINITY_DN14339_c0_g3_i2::g.86933::m.86933